MGLNTETLAEMLIRRAALTLSSPEYRERGDFRHFVYPVVGRLLTDTIDAVVKGVERIASPIIERLRLVHDEQEKCSWS